MGTDQWEALPTWNRANYLAELVQFIVFERGASAKKRSGFTMHPIQGQHPASATAIRNGLPDGQHKNWIDPEVLRYITKHNLYVH